MQMKKFYLCAIQISLYTLQKLLRRRNIRWVIVRAIADGKIIQSFDESIDGERNRRVRNERIILRRYIKRRLPQINATINANAGFPLDVREFPDLSTESLPSFLLTDFKPFFNASKIERKRIRRLEMFVLLWRGRRGFQKIRARRGGRSWRHAPRGGGASLIPRH